MKKIIFGFICGVIITNSITAFAGNSLVAYIFPSKVLIHLGNTVKELKTGDNEIINYNNKTYIPLRVFSEAMSSYVIYQKPTTETNNLNKIDIYMVDKNEFPICDSDRYVNLKVTKLESLNIPNQNYYVLSGLIRINKSMEKKKIEIVAINKEGTAISSIGSSFLIEGELFNQLEEGDLRYFNTRMELPEIPYSYSVKVVDKWSNPSEFAGGMGPEGDIKLEFGGIEQNSSISISNDKVMDEFTGIGIFNQSGRTLTVEPMNIEMQIIKIVDGNDQVICSYPISQVRMNMQPQTGFGISIPPWNFKDENGNLVTTGKYAVQLKLPENFEYYFEGSSELNKIPAEENMFNKRYEFNIIE